MAWPSIFAPALARLRAGAGAVRQVLTRTVPDLGRRATDRVLRAVGIRQRQDAGPTFVPPSPPPSPVVPTPPPSVGGGSLLPSAPIGAGHPAAILDPAIRPGRVLWRVEFTATRRDGAVIRTGLTIGTDRALTPDQVLEALGDAIADHPDSYSFDPESAGNFVVFAPTSGLPF